MGRSISNHRKRLARMLTQDDLVALSPPEARNNAYSDLIDIISRNWSTEVEQVVRDRVEAFITMARAEHSIEVKKVSRSSGSISVVKK
jgi:hypothetical protein